MADEVYDRLYYAGAELGEPVPSILRKATRDDAVMVVHSFSKSYCMTGWRVGWLVARRDLGRKATQLNEFIISHAPSFAQKAAETALAQGEEELARMLDRLKENRDLCLAALPACPASRFQNPTAHFTCSPKSPGLTDSFEFCRRLLVETRVGLSARRRLWQRVAKARSASATQPTKASWNLPWSGWRNSSTSSAILRGTQIS